MDAHNGAVLIEEDQESIARECNMETLGGAPAAAGDAGKERQHKKSKKKKKKKERERLRHRHKRERSEQQVAEGDNLDEPSCKKSRESPATSAPPPPPGVVAAALKELLSHLLRELEKRDTKQFFIEPVTDAIAPGYSSIICQPMSFVAMREKIALGQYTSLLQYESDVKLIVDNCLKYNGPDTVYYSAGKKLLAAAHTVLSREKLLALKKDIPSIALLAQDSLGVSLLDGSDEGGDSGGDDRTDSPNSPDSRSDDEEDDDDEDEEEEEQAARIIEQAKQAARAAATKLHNRKPTSTMGYLKPRPDGTMGLTFLTGCGGTAPPVVGQPITDSKPLNMGLVLGKLTAGSATLHNYHDDKRTMAKPVKPIHYGSYSSFCPSYDSTFANLSKEESDLVRATYGNETGVQYAESICDFSRDCGVATTLVDQLLNLLTSAQHSKTRSTITTAHQQQQLLQQQRLEQQEDKKERPQDNATDLNKLRSLSALGIDMSFLDSFEHPPGDLASTAALVQSLATEQNERLSKLPQQATPSQPSLTELSLADRLTSQLVSVARQLPPSALLPAPAPSSG